MTDEHTETDRWDMPDPTDERGDESDTTDRIAAAVADGARDGSLALLGGAAALLVAAREMRHRRGRAAVAALAGAGLTGLGIRQRESAASWGTEAEDESAESTSKETSDDARAAIERHEPNTEPGTGIGDERSPADGPPEDGVDAASDVSFTDERQEPRSKPGLDEDVEDPRRDDEGGVEIDVSDAATAAEPGEAVGPDPEQAQPTRTEGTEPEPEPEEDASHLQADVPEDESTDGEETESDEDEDEET